MPAPPPTSLLSLPLLLATFSTLLLAATLRLLAILPRGPFKPPPLRRPPPHTHVLIVLGSGGHTHEMLDLLRDLDTRKYTYRTYVISSGDAFSARRAAEFERALEGKERVRRKAAGVRDKNSRGDVGTQTTQGDGDGSTNEKDIKDTGPPNYIIHTLPRARRIHQSLLTTPLTALYALLSTLRLLLSRTTPPPDLIITNGPATGVIVVFAALILRFFNLRSVDAQGRCKTIYVESFARVTKLSLSGKCLVKVVDRFLVQWKELEGVGGRGEFCGVLV
ncbi:glycosyltransferase family 1 protein [Sporormia fimetaria CBS 119925]|uniref:UDP-N-acetylglucosamine transferase subunit ALG14 n=1 Tax=Sporormia fimetaria CBS 119925 TaxID=1340428 RepID=A0A6A6V6Z6_9PLEO|nr:glycosyltransferase family 1 protein [Sporormia fimetaria CBS 119925]